MLYNVKFLFFQKMFKVIFFIKCFIGNHFWEEDVSGYGFRCRKCDKYQDVWIVP